MRRRRLAAAGASLALAACEARVQLTQPAASAAPPALLTVVAGDTALAGRASWSPGVPGTTVFVRRDEDPTTLTFVTDSLGVLALSLPAASYWVSAERQSTAAERADPTRAPALLGGGARLVLSPGSRQTLTLRDQNNGSLVISEFYYAYSGIDAGSTGTYQAHWYIELYNNSDTTIYLDGKIVGAGFDYDIDAELWPCTETEPQRVDPRGIWSQRFQAFPGSGHDHPVAPGRTVVIAEQAIDHSAIYPGLPDLSHADFQFYWSSRALNPAVPTMLPIQLSTGVMTTMWLPGTNVAFIADPLDIASLERGHGRYQGDFALFPRGAILDVASLYNRYYLVRRSVPLCDALVDPSLDALGAFVIPFELDQPPPYLMSALRRLLPEGVHLQRTGTSAVDWMLGPRSPGAVP